MEHFDVSILVPTRNRRDYFSQTLSEIAAQDYAGKVQIVCSINGQKDDTAQFVQQFDATVFTNRGWKFEFYIQEKTLCIQDNWNFILDKALGKYVSFHLDDDSWDTDYLSYNVALLQKHPQCSFLISGDRTIDPNNATGEGWVGKSLTIPSTLGGVLKDGVNDHGSLLRFFVSRPGCNLSQIIFTNSDRRFQKEDGTHFDIGFVLLQLFDGQAYVSPAVKMSVRLDPQGYGMTDILTTNPDRELEISKSYLNALSRLQKDASLTDDLKDFAKRRATRSLVQFAKSVATLRPNYGFMTMYKAFQGGATTGRWQMINNIKTGADDR